MKLQILGAVVITAAMMSVGAAQMASVTDDEFIQKASAGNTFEIEEGKLALERASDANVKKFAQQMVADHEDALKKLQQATANSKTKAETKLDEAHQAKLDNLKTFQGADFDKVYKADQIASHNETVSLLSDYDQNGHDDALGDWVDAVLPKVKQHKAMIEAM